MHMLQAQISLPIDYEVGRREAEAMLICLGFNYPMKKSAKAPRCYLSSTASEEHIADKSALVPAFI